LISRQGKCGAERQRTPQEVFRREDAEGVRQLVPQLAMRGRIRLISHIGNTTGIALCQPDSTVVAALGIETLSKNQVE
jgi:hypothetical protein